MAVATTKKLCAKCHARERHVFTTGRVYSYCTECKVAFIAGHRKTVDHSIVSLRRLASYPKHRED